MNSNKYDFSRMSDYSLCVNMQFLLGVLSQHVQQPNGNNYVCADMIEKYQAYADEFILRVRAKKLVTGLDNRAQP